MARTNVANTNLFAALMQDDDILSDAEEETTPTVEEPPQEVTTPSKKSKATARKRAAAAAVTTPTPAVPSIPVQHQHHTLSAAPTVQEEQRTEEKAPEQTIQVESPNLTTMATQGKADDEGDSSDAETQEEYDDDDDDDDEEELTGAASSSPTSLTPLLPLLVKDPSATPPLLSSVSHGSPDSPPTEQLSSPSAASPIIVSAAYNAGADHDPTKKLSAIITRTIYGAAMAGGLIALILLGQIYVVLLVFLCQAVVFSELTSLFDAGYSSTNTTNGNGVVPNAEKEERRKGRRAARDRWSRMISWYFFAATNYFLYGESLIYYFKHILTFQFHPSTFSFAQHHRLISFGLYIIGFVGFVADLKRAQLRRQFGLFGWIHMSLLLVVVSSHFIVNNILEGLIWFWVPASLVITNDVAAYVCGMAFGRHQLIKLSPKKTVEGFVGAFFVTIVFAYFWATFFMRFNYMICPVQDLATNVLSDMNCVRNHAFIWRNLPLPTWAVTSLSTVGVHSTTIPWAPFQLHSIVLAVFASLVAPFGGFFASGFKRAFNIKDFGASIPGHGGLTDRMDCQFLMGLFTYVYYASLIRETHVTVSSIMSTVATALTTEQQLEMLTDLTRLLAAKGLNAVNPFAS